MISEKELSALSYPEAPKIVSDVIPGPKAKKLYDRLEEFCSPTRVPIRVPGSLAPAICDEGRGATVKDVDGNIYIDLSAGVAVLSVGRNHPRVVQIIKDQSEKTMHAGSIISPISIELNEKVCQIMPEGLRDNCFSVFTQSGSAAVETAIKFVHAITKKAQILAFEGAYHGSLLGSLALTTRSGFREGYGPFMPGALHMPYPYCYRCFAGLKYPSCGLACADYFESRLNSQYSGAEDVGAVFVEPIQGEGGYIDPPPEFFKRIKALCDKKGILFIADEVQSGAGRSGKMWAIEHYGVVPDMVVFGKGIGCDQPMAGVAVRRDLRDKLRPYSHANTFSENALACAVALTNIDILTNPRTDLIGRAARLENEVKNLLLNAAENSKVIGDIRGKGLMIGIELVKNKETKEPIASIADVVNKAYKRGVLALPCGRSRNVLRVAPPLIISKDFLERSLNIVLDVINESQNELIK